MSLLLSYYGDDFTGSTDALEALSLAGVRTVLLLEPPTPELLRAFPDAQAVGVAGTGRAMTPSEMEVAFPPLFAQLRALGAPVTHYKICSTFDSSPEVGSIGRALELGRAAFGAPFVPLLVGAPRLGRYGVFGHLFARAGSEGEVFRLDRHPVMSRHPVTPMGESDLRLHLAAQTAARAALFDLVQLEGGDAEVAARFGALLQENPEVVLFDALYDRHLETIGGLLWAQAQGAPLFAVASSGLSYALAAHWRASGVLDEPPTWAPLEGAPQVLAVSGSCSPVTARQIEHAVEVGYAEVALDTPRLVDPETAPRVHEEAVGRVLAALRGGSSVLLHTCLGPDDPRIRATSARLEALRLPRRASGKLLGSRLGGMLRTLLEASGVRRVVVAGGDSSGFVAAELGLRALTMTAPLAPGAPLCRAYAPGSALDGLELVFKGGQTGPVDFFTTARHGAPRNGAPQNSAPRERERTSHAD